MTKCWVLTRQINDYNQDGEYYEAVFAAKPNYQKMEKVLLSMGLEGQELIDHLLNGGGRRGYEETWYHLREVDLW